MSAQALWDSYCTASGLSGLTIKVNGVFISLNV